MRLLLLLVFALTLPAQTLRDRLSNPLSIELGVQPAYQANPLNLSPLDRVEAARDPGLLGGMRYADSRVVTLFGKLNYAPRLFGGRRTRLYLSLFNHRYLDTDLRTYWTGTASLKQSLGRWRFLELGGGGLPAFYLRHYDLQNHPGFAPGRYAARFGTTRLWIHYGFRPWQPMRVALVLTTRQEVYEPPFQHWSMDKMEGSVDVRWEREGWPEWSLRTTYGSSRNRDSYDGRDRSYHYLTFRPTLTLRAPGKLVKRVAIHGGYDQRAYLSEDLTDPLHAGRGHQEFRGELELTSPVRNGFIWQPFLGFRQRRVDATDPAIAEARSFQRWWAGIRISRKRNIDIYL